MNKKLLVGALLGLVIVAAGVAWYFADTQNSATPVKEDIASNPVVQSLTRKDNGEGGVTVEAILLTREYFDAIGQPDGAVRYEIQKYIVFRISIDTHSVDLSSYDVRRMIDLRDDRGNLYSATFWLPESNDSHHRSGILSFAKRDSAGNPVVPTETRFVELVIRDLAGVSERVLRWELSSIQLSLKNGALTLGNRNSTPT